MSSGPRWSLAALSFAHALVMAACAAVLPWPKLTLFAVLAGGVAVTHLVTAALALIGSRWRLSAWRRSSQASLAFFAYVTYAALGSGFYIAALYDGVGTAILAGSVAAWCVAALFTVPLASWGLAATGGLFVRRGKDSGRPGRGSGAAMLAIFAVFVAALEGHAARGEPRRVETETDLDRAAHAALDGLAAPASKGRPPQLFVKTPIACDVSPASSEQTVVFLTLLARGAKEPEPRAYCFAKADLEGALSAARAAIESDRVTGAALIDVVTRGRPLPEAGPLMGSVLVRPGLEGVCDRERCLLPWQLFGLDAFTEATAVAALSIEIGLTPEALRKRLGSDGAGFAGLDAFRTRTYLLDEKGVVEPRTHLRGGARPLEPSALDGALRDATGYIVSSQVADGRFRYLLDPFAGRGTFDGFGVPRQAGTTLVLCEASAFDRKAAGAAKKSLAMLTGLEQKNGDRSGIVFPKGAKRRAAMGASALTTIALLGCRDTVGHDFDGAIERLVRGLMSLQRPDGGFRPEWDPATGQPVEGRDALYAGGQGVFALVLYEQAKGLPPIEGIAEAIDRAMAYYAGPYWGVPLYDFFFLEENWHCMAAKAALTSHRNDAYERFCIDYMTMKARFIQGEGSGIDADQRGAYGFGHLFPPHHAATAGYGEALAALIAIKRARGVDTREDERLMAENLEYLLRHQWRDDNCQTCTRALRVTGGFSENVASPAIRIDFVQHATSSMLHGGEVLGLVGQGA
jgi:hypothetical protein